MLHPFAMAGIFEPAAPGFVTGEFMQTVLRLSPENIIETSLRILGVMQKLRFNSRYLVGKLTAVDTGIQVPLARLIFYIIKWDRIDTTIVIEVGRIQLHGSG